MAFRYINPGYVALLDSDVTATEVLGTTYSKTGVGFNQTNSSAGIILPNFQEGDDFWILFDVYIPDSYTELYCFFTGVGENFKRGILIFISDSQNTRNNRVYVLGNKTLSYAKDDVWAINYGETNTIALHIHFGDSDSSLVEVWINGVKISGTGMSLNYTSTAIKKTVLYTANNTSSVFSNVIISSEEISPKERVIALSVSATETDMTAGASGIYIADAADQTLLQSVDVESLIANYGASSAVTGVALVGNPAYKTAEGLASLISLSNNGGSIAEHGTINLSSDSSAMIMDSWTLENTTIADLQDMQFGWKVGE